MRQARMLKDLTMEEMAMKMGVSPWIYRQIETDPERATVAQVKRFCQIVGINYDRIFFTQQVQ